MKIIKVGKVIAKNLTNKLTNAVHELCKEPIEKTEIVKETCCSQTPRDKRIIQLVGREGVLSELLKQYETSDGSPVPSPSWERYKVLKLMYEETLSEMKSLDLELLED